MSLILSAMIADVSPSCFAAVPDDNCSDSNPQKYDAQQVRDQAASGQRIDLHGYNLKGADLEGLDLDHADFMWACLVDAKLVGTHLNGADLRGATLSGAEMSNALLRYANVDGLNFEPSTLPDIRGMSQAMHLERVSFDDDPDALIDLRKTFKQGGYTLQEREVTYAFERRQNLIAWSDCTAHGAVDRCFVAFFDWLMFDVPSRYGLQPDRTLACVAVLWIVGFCAYPFCMKPKGKTGIFVVVKNSISGNGNMRTIRIVAAPSNFAPARVYKIKIPLFDKRTLRAAACFSTLSAFNIGFRELNVGQWLHMLMRRDFDMQAIGWARTIAGIQALVSVYMLALWLLTTFGNPFIQ
jgi:hypothetical protein